MKRSSLILRLLSYLKPYRLKFIQSQIFMLVAAISGLAFPLAVRNMFDASTEKQSMGYVISSISILAALFMVKELSEYVKTRMLEYISQNITKDVRILTYSKLQQKSLDFYYKRKSGDIVSSFTNDINLFQQSVSTGISFLVQTAISIIFVTILLFYTNVILSIIVIAFIPAVTLLTRYLGNKVRPVSVSARKKQGYVTSIINESISGADIIKAFVLKKHAVNIFTDGTNRLLEKTLEETRVKAGTTMAIGLVNAAQILLITGIGGYQVFTGQISAGTLIAFILYTQMISGPMSMLSGIYVEIQKSIAAVERIFEIVDHDDEIPYYGHEIGVSAVNGSICFNNVYFSYNGEQPVLKGINLSIPPLKTAAFVGPSGAGKSTLFRLIPRFYEVTSGEIRIDDINVRNIGVDVLRSNIAIVPQETYLFGMSIGDNIACGKPEASYDEIIKAAQMANAHEFIMKLENGYDTIAGERGAGLSGGQKQRIAIARAFVKNPKILLLDEATSSLDSQSESQVQEAIYKLMEGRTTLIIAHRLSTIINADIIFVMDAGEIIASGTHKELLESCMLYRKMYQQGFGYDSKAC